MTTPRPIPTLSAAYLWIALASGSSCVLNPAGLDAGLETGESETGPSGDGDGDGEPTGDGDGEPTGDGDGEPTGDGDGEPTGGEPFGCLSASALDGSPAPLPASDCTMLCEEPFEGGQTLEFVWSIDVDDGAIARALIDGAPSTAGLFAVDQRPALPVRIRWFDEDGGLAQLLELDIDGGIYDADRDDTGLLYVVYPDPEFSADIAIGAFDIETGAREWSSSLLDRGPSPLLTGASDGFVMWTSKLDMSGSTVIRYVHDIPEPYWLSPQLAVDAGQALGVSPDGTVALSSPEALTVISGAGELLDTFPQLAVKRRIRDLVFDSPADFYEAADGPDLGPTVMQPSATVDAVLTDGAVDGTYHLESHRWGDLDCDGELVPGHDRFNALAVADGGGVVAVGEESYEFTPGDPTWLARITEFSADQEVLGSARLALPDTTATAVVAIDAAIYVVVHDTSGAAFNYQIRKYHRATP